MNKLKWINSMFKILMLSSLIALTSLSAMAVEPGLLQLDRNRTSVEFAGPVTGVTKAIIGHKWLGQTEAMNGGVSFESHINPQFGKNNTESGGAIMVKATFYTYQSVSKEAIMVARQSEIPGFVELYGYDSPDLQLHIKVIDDGSFESYPNTGKYLSQKEHYTYKKVDAFNKSPHADKLKSASESGMIF